MEALAEDADGPKRPMAVDSDGRKWLMAEDAGGQDSASGLSPVKEQRSAAAQPHGPELPGASILCAEMGEIDPVGMRKGGLDAFLDEKLAEGFTVERRTDTHAIIFRRPKGLRRFTSGDDPGRFVVEVDEHGRVTMREAEPRRS